MIWKLIYWPLFIFSAITSVLGLYLCVAWYFFSEPIIGHVKKVVSAESNCKRDWMPRSGMMPCLEYTADVEYLSNSGNTKMIHVAAGACWLSKLDQCKPKFAVDDSVPLLSYREKVVAPDFWTHFGYAVVPLLLLGGLIICYPAFGGITNGRTRTRRKK